jgi:hypothetical protein
LGICALDLLVKGLDVRWEEAVEFERFALFLRERRAFVEVWRSKKCIALSHVSTVPCGFPGARTVRLVSCAPDVERGRCPNLGFFSDFDLFDMLAIDCWPTREMFTIVGR